MNAAQKTRVDLILRVRNDHGFVYAASKDAASGEEWRCRCGESYKGDGALDKGHRHQAAEVLLALDEAGAVA